LIGAVKLLSKSMRPTRARVKTGLASGMMIATSMVLGAISPLHKNSLAWPAPLLYQATAK
jgi:hypothetical protein